MDTWQQATYGQTGDQGYAPHGATQRTAEQDVRWRQIIRQIIPLQEVATEHREHNGK